MIFKNIFVHILYMVAALLALKKIDLYPNTQTISNMSTSYTSKKSMGQICWSTLKLLMLETMDLTHTTLSNMSPQGQILVMYTTFIGSAVATTLVLTKSFGTREEREMKLTLEDLVPKRVCGHAEGTTVVIPVSPKSLSNDLDTEINDFNSTELSDSITATHPEENNKENNNNNENENEIAPATKDNKDEVVFEQSGTLGTYYIVGETKPTPKQQLENLLDTLINDQPRDRTPCPPSFRKKERNYDEHGNEENMQENESDYRLLSNKAYYPTAMASVSNSVTKSWVRTQSRRSNTNNTNNTNKTNNTNSNTNKNIPSVSTSTDRFRVFVDRSQTVAKSSRIVSHDMRELSALSRQPRIARSAGKLPPQRSGLNRFSAPLPSPSMNRMRTRDQHLSYNNTNNSSSSSGSNVVPGGFMSATKSKAMTGSGSGSSDWISATPSPSLPNAVSSATSLSSPSPAAPSPRSQRSYGQSQQQQQQFQPDRRSGSVLGPSRSNGAARAPMSTMSLTSQKLSKQLAKSKKIGDAASAAPKRGSSTLNTEVRRIQFNMPTSPPKAINNKEITKVMGANTPPSKASFNSPAKQKSSQSTPASPLSRSPAQQRAVSRTLRYTPAKLPSTTNRMVGV